MSKKSCPGKDEGRKHSGRRDSWCQPDVLKAGEEGSVAAVQWEGERWPSIRAGCT